MVIADLLVEKLYLNAIEQEDVPLDCGFTPLEHFIKGEDGVLRLQGNHIHIVTLFDSNKLTADTIRADRIYLE